MEDFYRSSTSSGSSKIWRLKTEIQLPTNSQEKFTKATSDLQDLIETYTEMLKSGDTAGKNQLLFNNLNRIMNPVPGRFKLQIVRKDTITEDLIYLEKALIRKSPKIIGITPRPPPDQVEILKEFLAKAGTPLRVMYSGSDSSPLKKFLDDRGAVGSGQSGRAINNIFEILVYTTTKIIPLASRRIKGEDEAKDAELNKKTKDAENAKIAKNNKDAKLILDAVQTIVAKALEIKQYSADENGGEEVQVGGDGYTFKAEYDGLLGEIETAKRVLTSDEIAPAADADAEIDAAKPLAAKPVVKLGAADTDETAGGAGTDDDDDATNAAKPAEKNKIQPLVIKDVAVAKSLKKFDAAYAALKKVVDANDDSAAAAPADNAGDNTDAIAALKVKINASDEDIAKFNTLVLAQEEFSDKVKRNADARVQQPNNTMPFPTDEEVKIDQGKLDEANKKINTILSGKTNEQYIEDRNKEKEAFEQQIAALENTAAPGVVATPPVDAKKLAEIDAKIAKLIEDQKSIQDLVNKKQQLNNDIETVKNNPSLELSAEIEPKTQELAKVDADIQTKIGKSYEKLQAEIDDAEAEKETLLENENPAQPVKETTTATGKNDIKTLAASLYEASVKLQTDVKAAVEKINPSVKAEVKPPPPAAEKAAPSPSSALNSDFANQLNELKKQMAENQAAAAADKDKNVKASIEAIMDDPYLYGQTLRLKVHVPPEQLFAMAAPTGSDLENWLKSFAVDTLTQEDYNKVALLTDKLKDETGKATSFGDKIKALATASEKYNASKKTAPVAAGVGAPGQTPVVAGPEAAKTPVVAANAGPEAAKTPVVSANEGGAGDTDAEKAANFLQQRDEEDARKNKEIEENKSARKTDANKTGANEKPGASKNPEDTNEKDTSETGTSNKGANENKDTSASATDANATDANANKNTDTPPSTAPGSGTPPGTGSPTDADKAALVLAWDELWGLIESYKEHLADFEKDLKQKKAVENEKNNVQAQAGGDPTLEQIQQAFTALDSIPQKDKDGLIKIASDPENLKLLMKIANGDQSAQVTLGLKLVSDKENLEIALRMAKNPQVRKIITSLQTGVPVGNTGAKTDDLMRKGVGASAVVEPVPVVAKAPVVAVVPPAQVAPEADAEALKTAQAEAEAEALKTAQAAEAEAAQAAKEAALKEAALKEAAPKSTGIPKETTTEKEKTVNNTIELAMHTLVQTAYDLLLRTYPDYLTAGGLNKMNGQAGGGVPTDAEIAAKAQQLAVGTPLAGDLTPTLIAEVTALIKKLKTETDQKLKMKAVGEFLREHEPLVTNITQFGTDFANKVIKAKDDEKITIATELVKNILGIDLNDPLYADQTNQLQLAINVLNMIKEGDQAQIIKIATDMKNINMAIDFLITGEIPKAELAKLTFKNMLLARRLKNLMEKPEFKEALNKLNASLGLQSLGEVSSIDLSDSSENNEGEGEGKGKGKEGDKGEGEGEEGKGNKGEGEEGNKGEEVKAANAPQTSAAQTPTPAEAQSNKNPPDHFTKVVNEILKTMTDAYNELNELDASSETDEAAPTVEMGLEQPTVQGPTAQEENGQEQNAQNQPEEKEKTQGGAKSRKNKKRYTKNKRNKNKHKKGTKKNGKKSTRRKSKKN